MFVSCIARLKITSFNKFFWGNPAFTLRWIIFHAYRQRSATFPRDLAIKRTSPRRAN